MSFGSHAFSDDDAASASPAIASANPAAADSHPAPACPLHSWMPARFRSKAPKMLRIAGWSAKFTAIFFVLASVKCILLYVVLPALAVGWFASAPSTADLKEPVHATKVPASCPFQRIVDSGEDAKPPVQRSEDADTNAAR